MRVVAGHLKGRSLAGPTGPGVRPTSDRLRETIFNLVDVSTPGCRVLDAFAGTGALGIEAISRGAAAAVFVERDRRAAAVIRENVSRCGIREACTILCSDFLGMGDRAALGPPFDLVLLDPPYGQADLTAVLEVAGRAVRSGGLVVLEHARRDTAPARAGSLEQRRTITAGDSQVTFYAVVDAAAAH